jgi:hypothetical protein
MISDREFPVSEDYTTVIFEQRRCNVYALAFITCNPDLGAGQYSRQAVK